MEVFNVYLILRLLIFEKFLEFLISREVEEEEDCVCHPGSSIKASFSIVTITILRYKTHQHVHEDNGHSQHKHKEQDICQRSVFQFTPRHKVAGIVEFTQGHHKYGHHGIRKSGIWLLKIMISR